MILKTIMDQLATGSISVIKTRGNRNVYPAGENSDELLKPYVIVYDDYPLNVYFTLNGTAHNIAVDVHFPIGMIDELNKYVEEELIELLHRKRLTTAEGQVFQMYATNYVSQMQEPNDDKSITGGNDDGTISRLRRFIIPRRIT